MGGAQRRPQQASALDDTARAAAPKRSSLTVNALAQTAANLLGYSLSFASAPVVLSGLGLRAFGIWAVTGAIAQYAALVDLGARSSLARYIAANAGDRDRCGQYMAIGWAAVLVVAVTLALAAIPAAPFLSRSLGGVSPGAMRTILWAATALACTSMMVSIITAFPIGLGRMVRPNVGIALGATLNFLATIGLILLGAHLVGYALANAAAGALSVLLIAALIVKGEGRLPCRRPSRPVVREFLSFSIKTQLVRCMDLVNFQTDKIVIGFAAGPAAAGAYELANRVALAVRDIGAYATSALMIELTSVMAREGLEAVRQRYARVTAVAVTVAFPGVLLAMAAGPLLLKAWLAHPPRIAGPVLVALCAAYLVSVSTATGFSVACAAGEPGIVARTSTAAAAMNLLLTVALAPVFGVWGVLAGTVLALSGGALAQVVLVHRRFGLPLSAYTRAVLPPLRALGLAAVPVALLAYAPLEGSRLFDATLLFALSAAYAVVWARWALRHDRMPAGVRDRLLSVRPRPATA